MKTRKKKKHHQTIKKRAHCVRILLRKDSVLTETSANLLMVHMNFDAMLR